MSRRQKTVYDEVFRLAHRYFGAESALHLSKFIGVHLRKSPEEMTKDELVSLIDWIKSTTFFLAEDEAIVERYIKDLLALAEPEET